MLTTIILVYFYMFKRTSQDLMMERGRIFYSVLHEAKQH